MLPTAAKRSGSPGHCMALSGLAQSWMQRCVASSAWCCLRRAPLTGLSSVGSSPRVQRTKACCCPASVDSASTRAATRSCTASWWLVLRALTGDMVQMVQQDALESDMGVEQLLVQLAELAGS